MTELDQIAAIIPKLEAQHVSTVKFVRAHLNVPVEFLATVIAAVEQTPELQGVNKLDVSAARDTLQFIEAFRPVLDKVAAFARNLQLHDEVAQGYARGGLAADLLPRERPHARSEQRRHRLARREHEARSRPPWPPQGDDARPEGRRCRRDPRRTCSEGTRGVSGTEPRGHAARA
jgi:hypothetical protein